MHLVYSLSLAFLGLFDTNAVGARPQKLPLHKTLARRPPWMPVSKALQWADVHLIDGRSTTVAPDPSTLLSAKRVEQISIFLQPWLAIYRSLPKVVVPGLNLDIAFTLVCALIFTCIDYACAFVINSSLAWPWIESRAAAGSLTTIIHASVLVVGLLICLVTEPYSPSKRMDSHPLWWQDASSALIQLCTGYMVR